MQFLPFSIVHLVVIALRRLLAVKTAMLGSLLGFACWANPSQASLYAPTIDISRGLPQTKHNVCLTWQQYAQKVNTYLEQARLPEVFRLDPTIKHKDSRVLLTNSLQPAYLKSRRLYKFSKQGCVDQVELQMEIDIPRSPKLIKELDQYEAGLVNYLLALHNDSEQRDQLERFVAQEFKGQIGDSLSGRLDLGRQAMDGYSFKAWGRKYEVVTVYPQRNVFVLDVRVVDFRANPQYKSNPKQSKLSK